MGQGLIFTVDNSSKPSVNLTGGPLSYKYEWHQMALHFGLSNQSGSEHTIGGRAFPAEVRFFKLNSIQLVSLPDDNYPITHPFVIVASLRLQHSTLQYLQRSAGFAQRYRRHLSPSPGQCFHSIYSLYQLKQTDIKKKLLKCLME